MIEKEYKFTCQNCDNTFTIITDEDEIPTGCPFCGSNLEENYDEQDNNEEDD